MAAGQLGFAQEVPAGTKPDDKPATIAGNEVSDEVVKMDAFKVSAGFSGSLAAATETKQRQTLVTEAIHAEDIGKLPDISIAESLTRLPGVTTQRLNGRAQAIVIRGMNGDFSTALLNGRAQVSSSAGRSVEFDQYPAELLNSVLVYKTTDASLVGQGLAGTVDLQTVRPLSQSRRTIAVNAFYEWTDMSPANANATRGGWRETFSYIDQYNEGKVGFAIGISNSDRPGQGEQFNAWGYPNANNDSNLPFVIGGAKPFVRTSELKRKGYMAVLEFAPSEKIHSTLDVYYSDFMENQLLRGIEIPLQWSSAVLQPGYTAENNLITKGTFTNVYGVARNDYVKRDDDLVSLGWNVAIGDKKGWRTDFDVSYSRIKRTDFVLETYSGLGSSQANIGTADTMSFVLQGEGGATFTSLLDYSDGSLMRLCSPQGWGYDAVTRPYGQMGFLKGPIAKDEISQYKITTQHPMKGIFSRFEAGLAFNRREKSEVESGPDGMEGYFIVLKNKASNAPMPQSVGVTDLSFLGLGGLYSYDPMAAFNSGIYDLVPNNNPAYMSNNWNVEEKVGIAYAKFDIEKKLGSIPVTGNIGAQLLKTEQTAVGQSVNNGNSTITPVVGTHDYYDFVPSLNLNFHLTEQQTLRMSVARQLARQPMVDMRAGSTYSFNQSLASSTDPTNSPWSSSGGNPQLEPWRSNSFDLSYEHYFKDHMGYWAVAAFYKDLVSYTYTQNKIVDFNGLPTGVTGVNPQIYQGYSSVPQNGQGGSVRGLELALSLPGEKFTPVLKGFGFTGSISFFKSSVRPDLGNPDTPLPGLSDRVMTGTVYYERGGFSARVSTRYRSEYRGDIATFGPRGAVYRNLQPETIVDAQLSYSFTKGTLKGLSFIAQAYNLTDEPLKAASGDDTRFVQDYHRYGASYSVGASFKF